MNRRPVFHVFLDHRHKTDIDNGNERENDHVIRQVAAGTWRNGEHKADKAVSTQLEHNGCQDNGSFCRRFNVGIRQPGLPMAPAKRQRQDTVIRFQSVPGSVMAAISWRSETAENKRPIPAINTASLMRLIKKPSFLLLPQPVFHARSRSKDKKPGRRLPIRRKAAQNCWP